MSEKLDFWSIYDVYLVGGPPIWNIDEIYVHISQIDGHICNMHKALSTGTRVRYDPVRMVVSALVAHPCSGAESPVHVADVAIYL